MKVLTISKISNKLKMMRSKMLNAHIQPLCRMQKQQQISLRIYLFDIPLRYKNKRHEKRIIKN